MVRFLAALAVLLIAGQAEARTITAATIETSSAEELAAASGRQFLAITNESTTATIACNFGGAAALNTAGNYTITPGATRTWSGTTAETLVSSSAVNCISDTASTPATIETGP